MKLSFPNFSAKEATEAVRSWINSDGNFLKISLKDEIILREALTDFTEAKGLRHDQVDGFANFLLEKYPTFFRKTFG